MRDKSQSWCYMKIFYLCIFVVNFLPECTQCAIPVLHGLPADEYIGDLETGERLIDFLNVTQNDDGYTCDVTAITGTLAGTPVATNGDEFETKYDGPNDRYELWTTTAGVGLFDASVIDEYKVSVECTNGGGGTSNGNSDHFVVNVINDRLIFVTLPASSSRSAAATPSTTTIYTETVTDDAGSSSSITCSLKSASVTGYFDVNAATCAVTTIANLDGIDASIPSVTLIIAAQDSVTKLTSYETLTVVLSNQNTKPTTSTNGAAVSQTWSEATPVGTILESVTVSDPDSGQTHTYSMDCTPTSGDSFIDINAAGEIKVISALNYETANYFDCNYYINDGKHTGGPFRYELTISNVNDAPTFVDAIYYLTIPEGAAGTVPTFNPTLSCIDDDTTDTHSYGFVTSTYSQYFSVDNSGQFTLAQDYDIDNSANPTNLVLEIICVDGSTIDNTILTGTATLSVSITDINDNPPTFTPATYTIYVDQYVTAGTIIGTYAPNDPDTAGGNGMYECSATSASSYGTTYGALSDCSFILNLQNKPFGDGTTVQYTVTATDKGTPALTGTGYVNVVYRETSTTTSSTTTTTDYNFFDHPENIAIFVLLLLAGLILLGLLTWCLCMMCNGGNMCDCGMRGKRYPKRRAITPEEDKTPPRRRYSPEPQKVTVIRERPALPTVYKPAPPYYAPPGRYPGPAMPPPGTFPNSPFVPYR
ncbi:hypothetical protein ACF0H5_023463 [Mactra antiquata]